MAKENKVVLKNTGICTIYFNGIRHLPGDTFELDESDLENKGIESLIHRGDLVIKGDSEATEQVKEKVEKRRKKDPTEGKSIAELENGGVY